MCTYYIHRGLPWQLTFCTVISLYAQRNRWYQFVCRYHSCLVPPCVLFHFNFQFILGLNISARSSSSDCPLMLSCKTFHLIVFTGLVFFMWSWCLCLLCLSSFCFNLWFFIPPIIFPFLIFIYLPAQIIKCCLSANIWWLWMLRKLDYDIIMFAKGTWQPLVILSVMVILCNENFRNLWCIWMQISRLIAIFWISNSLQHPRFPVRKLLV